MTSSYVLWSDESATQDLLAFRAVAETALDAIFDDGLDPAAIGLSGAWGSGKTSMLEFGERNVEDLLPTAVLRMIAFACANGATQ